MIPDRDDQICDPFIPDTSQDVKVKVSFFFFKVNLDILPPQRYFKTESFATLDVVSDLGAERHQKLNFFFWLSLLLKPESRKRLFELVNSFKTERCI